MKKFIALFLALVMLMALATGCASSSQPSNDAASNNTTTSNSGDAEKDTTADITADTAADAAPAGGYKIALCNNSMSETWRVQMVAEFEQAAEAYKASGVISEYYETNADADASKQIADMEDLIAKGVDGILIAPQNPTALNDVISEAMDAGIKVVVFNNYVDSSFTNYTAYVNQDGKEFGKINAQFLVDALGGKGKIILLQYPDIEIVGEANGNWDYADGKAATEALLSANPEIDGVWSQGGAMTQGAIDAFVAAGRPLVPMSGEAGNGFLASWIKYRGVDKFDSVAPLYDTGIVVDALDILVRALNGETVEKTNILPMDSITVDTVSQYYREDLPDSYWAGSRLSDENLKKLFEN